MIFKNKNTQNNIKPKEEPKKDIEQPVEQVATKPIRKVINGQLYDTSKATRILECFVFADEIPNFDACSHLSIPVKIYKGNTKWFFTYYSNIVIVDENWAKDVIGRNNVEKYIELFGEPELA